MSTIRICFLLLVSIWSFLKVWAFEPIPQKPNLQYFQRLYHIQQMNYLIYKDLDKLRQDYPGTMVAESLKYRVRWMVLKDFFADEQILCIRGTNNLLNAWIDSQYFLKFEPKLGIKVHRGFNKAIKEIIPSIRGLLDPNRKVILSGHSMGGSMAILLAMYLEQEGYDIQWIVTMGQPKITNQEGVLKYNYMPVLRVVYQLDLIPTLPPPIVSKYKHFGAELNLLKSGFNYQIEVPQEDNSNPDLLETNSLWQRIRSESKHSLNQNFRVLHDIDSESSDISENLELSWLFGLRHAMDVYRQKILEIIQLWEGHLPGIPKNQTLD